MKRAVFVVFMVLLILIFLEGASSIVLNLYNSIYIYRHSGTAGGSATETQYDDTLGWVNTPNVHAKDMYGPGKSISHNSQGFRNSSDIAPVKAKGITRVAMIGDSFVFGSENGDDDTLAVQMQRKARHLECINMGVPCYGADQAYLHYLKNGQSLNPDIVLFCVHPTVIDRASRLRWANYYKPLIKIRGDQLRITNIPVPKPVPARSSLFTKQDAALLYVRNMTTSQLLKKALKASGVNVDAEAGGIEYGLDLMPYMLRDLKSKTDSARTRIVVVSLPMYQDYFQGALTDKAEKFNDKLRVICENTGTDFVDLSDVFASLDDAKLRAFFHTDWHYNEQGVGAVSAGLLPHVERLRRELSKSQ